MTRCFRVVDLRVSIFIFLLTSSLHVRLLCVSPFVFLRMSENSLPSANILPLLKLDRVILFVQLHILQDIANDACILAFYSDKLTFHFPGRGLFIMADGQIQSFHKMYYQRRIGRFAFLVYLPWLKKIRLPTFTCDAKIARAARRRRPLQNRKPTNARGVVLRFGLSHHGCSSLSR